METGAAHPLPSSMHTGEDPDVRKAALRGAVLASGAVVVGWLAAAALTHSLFRIGALFVGIAAGFGAAGSTRTRRGPGVQSTAVATALVAILVTKPLMAVWLTLLGRAATYGVTDPVEAVAGYLLVQTAAPDLIWLAVAGILAWALSSPRREVHP